jgi:hypothetical protein
MKRLITIELRKLATTPALYFCAAITFGLTVMSVFATILLAGKGGSPAVGSVDNVSKVFAVGALTSMVALALGIMMVSSSARTWPSLVGPAWSRRSSSPRPGSAR